MGMHRALAAGRHGRIRGVTALVGMTLAMSLASVGSAIAQDPSQSNEPRLLFFQEFQSGTLVPAPQGSNVTITLQGGTGETAFATNWPDRIVGTVQTSNILTAVAASVNAPPEAVIVSDLPDGSQATYVVQILGAQQPSTTELTYDAWYLGSDTAGSFQLASPAPQPTAQVTLGLTHVFIDGLAGVCLSC